MYLKQTDLFWGMSQNAIQSITAKAVKQEFQEGETVFKADDPADTFFVLIKGKVRMELQPTGRKVYCSERVGEIFGWSALIGRNVYSATVVCEQHTMVLKFPKDDVLRLLEKDAENAVIFYKQLAGALGNRLLRTYDILE